MIDKIAGEYDDWVVINKIAPEAEIDDGIQILYCDTRDFAMGWQFKQPEITKEDGSNHDRWCNEGVRNLKNLQRTPNRDKYIIPKGEIIKWLTELCERTGGFDKDWRAFSAVVKDCGNWNLKYIRFVRDIENPDNFIVCNAYMQPIHWKEIIPKLSNLY